MMTFDELLDGKDPNQDEIDRDLYEICSHDQMIRSSSARDKRTSGSSRSSTRSRDSILQGDRTSGGPNRAATSTAGSSNRGCSVYERTRTTKQPG
jgi:hypothetical protein